MDPPPAFRFPPRDAHPLQSLSPERVNGNRNISSTSTLSTKSTRTVDSDSNRTPPTSPTRKANLFSDYHPSLKSPPKSIQLGGGLPQSPSLPEISALRSHGRTNSDVQGLVKRFEHLDVRDKDAESAERRRRHEAEVKRHLIAREEAESDAKRLREELRALDAERKEGLDRERRVAKRIEALMDEYTRSKDQYTSQSAIYEKEVRRARKEAFKSSSAVLKLQEDAKASRSVIRRLQVDLDTERQKTQQKEQETFSAQYQFVAVQEELDKLKTELKIVKEEKDSLMTNLKEEEVARIAAEGRIALPPPAKDDEDDDLLSSPRRGSPRKLPGSPLSDDKENAGIVTKKMVETRRLHEEVQLERMKRQAAEEMIEFLHLECAFKCCGCKTADRHGRKVRLSLDELVAAEIERMKADMGSIFSPAANERGEEMDVDGSEVDDEKTIMQGEPTHQSEPVSEAETTIASHELDAVRTEMEEDDERSLTLGADESTPTPAPEEEDIIQAPRPTPIPDEDENALSEPEGNATVRVPPQPSTPPKSQYTTSFRKASGAMRTVTTTTTIPMQFTPVRKPSFQSENTENIPPSEGTAEQNCAVSDLPFDREAALAAIAYRRGRAKSLANGHMTPRKQMLEGVNVKERRDISAPALGGKIVANISVHQGGSVGRPTGRIMV